MLGSEAMAHGAANGVHGATDLPKPIAAHFEAPAKVVKVCARRQAPCAAIGTAAVEEMCEKRKRPAPPAWWRWRRPLRVFTRRLCRFSFEAFERTIPSNGLAERRETGGGPRRQAAELRRS